MVHLLATIRLPNQGVYYTYKTREKKVQLVHSLSPALTLTLSLTLNHLANKLQQTTSALFCLGQHSGHSQRTINIMFQDLT